MSSYMFENASEDGDARLSALERACDPVTIRRLGRLGPMTGWSCLEVGAGSGSIARWLSSQVGINGRLLVTDIDPRFLQSVPWASDSVELRRHDIVTDDLPSAAFDLIHARHVFVHIPSAEQTLSHLVTALKPGGWLVIEDYDNVIDRTMLFTDRALAETVERVLNSTWRLFAKRGSAIAWGRRLTARFRDSGLSDVGGDAEFHCVTGRSAYTQFQRGSFERARAEAVADGLASDADFDTVLALLDDPYALYYSNPFFAAWGRRSPT